MRDFPDKKKIMLPNAFYFLEVQNAKLNLREHFFKKIQDPKEFENGFCVSLLNRSIQDLSGRWCVKGTEESTSRVNSSVPLTHRDPRDLGLICLTKKRKIRFRILSDFFRIFLDFLKETNS